MILTLLLFFVATFGLVSAGVVGYHFLMERRALAGQTGHRQGIEIEWVEASDLLKSDSLSSISFWDSLLTRVDYVKIMRSRIAEAGLHWSVGRVTLAMLLVAALAMAILSSLKWLPVYVIFGGSLLAGAMPYAWILSRRQKRLFKFESEFPDALDSLSRALRAGHPLSAGLQMLALESGEPIATEMRTTVRERGIGSSWEEALGNLARRVPLSEVSIFVAAVSLQNRTGGKLSEVLGRLAETMRESEALKGEIRSIAAHGKLTGLVLMVLPLLIAAIMAVVNPSYLALLLVHPGGKLMIGGAIICLILARVVIGRLVDIRL